MRGLPGRAMASAPGPAGPRVRGARVRGRPGDLYRFAATLAGWGAFGLACVLWGIFVVPPTLVLSRPWPAVRDRFSDVTSAVLRLYVRTLPFMRLRVEGGGRRRVGPRIVVANHQSWLDPIVLMSLERRLAGPARGYNFRVPIMRTILRLAGFHPADAGEPASLEHLHEAARRAVQRGGGLLFFPEGTRSLTGAIGPFHRGAFRTAVDHGLPIQPVLIEGLDRVLPPGRLVAQTPGRPVVRVRYLEPIEPPYGVGVRREVVRALAARARDLMVAELARMRAERDPEGGDRIAERPRPAADLR
jgi:1-acyl-sn-glycerol-3-phosphate acyltransferase